VLAAQSAGLTRPFYGCYSHGWYAASAVRLSNEGRIAASLQFIADSPNAGRINAQIKVGFDGGAEVIKESGGYYGKPIYLAAHVHGPANGDGYVVITVYEWCQGWHYWFYEVRLRPDSEGGVIIWLADEGGSGDFLPV